MGGLTALDFATTRKLRVCMYKKTADGKKEEQGQEEKWKETGSCESAFCSVIGPFRKIWQPSWRRPHISTQQSGGVGNQYFSRRGLLFQTQNTKEKEERRRRRRLGWPFQWVSTYSIFMRWEALAIETLYSRGIRRKFALEWARTRTSKGRPSRRRVSDKMARRKRLCGRKL